MVILGCGFGAMRSLKVDVTRASNDMEFEAVVLKSFFVLRRWYV